MSDRDVFIGGHLTEQNKEKFRKAALARDMSMSALLSEIVEIWLGVEDERIGAVVVDPAVEAALAKEQDQPLPLE